MQDIRRVIQQAARRLLVVRLFDSWAWTVTFAVAAVVLVIVVDRAFALGIGESSWRSMPVMAWVGLGSLAAALVAGGVWAVVTRPRESGVAHIVDERAGLRESLSTALCVERESDPWSRAVIESATDKARRVVVRDAVPIEGPSAWRFPTAAIVVLLLTFFLMPKFDLLGNRAEAQAAADAREEIEAAVQDARDTEAQIREIMQRTGLGEEEPTDDAELDAELTKPRTPDEIRKEAIRKLTDLNDKLSKKMDSEEAKSLDAVKDMMRRLTTPGHGELSEFARQLSRGNFDKARQELESLNQKLQNGELSEEQKEQLQQQMQSLAEQMQSLSEQQGAMQQALQKAGITPEQAKQLASNPQALQQALQNNQNLSDAQKQQLQQMANAMQQAASQCQGMSQAMSQMAQGMSQQGSQGAQQGMDSMSGQLSSMEMMQAEMQAMSDAMGECQGQMAALGECSGGGSGSSWAQGANKPGMTGQFSQGSSMSQGSGSGGPGKGNGAGPDAQAADFYYKGEKANVQNQGGATIASRYVFEEQVRGEATAEFGAAIEQAAEQAAEEIANMNVDPQFRAAVKHYYGRLGERVKAEQAKTSTESTSGEGTSGGQD